MVREVTRYWHNPSKNHSRTVLNIVEKLEETRMMGIQRPLWSVVAFDDSRFAENKESRKSVSGGGGVELCAGAVISWLGRTEHFVTLSSTEREHVY